MLRDQVESFIANGGKNIAELYGLLRECVTAKFPEGLACVRMLLEANYGPYRVNGDVTGPAATILLIWGRPGMQTLFEVGVASESAITKQMCLQQLATIAAGGFLAPFSFMRDPGLEQYIDTKRIEQPELVGICRHYISEFVSNLKTDESLAGIVGNAIGNLQLSEIPAARELFSALSYQWMTVGSPVLAKFEELITESPDDEKSFQEFLTVNPQILDPMVVQIWPEANIFGSRFPDFLLRRADGTYLVVEIECPGKPLVVQGGQLSAHVTHAEAQVADYRSYLAAHLESVRQYFPNFGEMDCLVVTGLERNLSVRQKSILSDANRHRHGLRIVGFDWLADRSRAISMNLARQGVETIQLRVT